jgi:hypothetical protein
MSNWLETLRGVNEGSFKISRKKTDVWTSKNKILQKFETASP